MIGLGEDETFGRLGTDVEMAAGGHRYHRVVLGGLEPGTAYVFRLQGSGALPYRSRFVTSVGSRSGTSSPPLA